MRGSKKPRLCEVRDETGDFFQRVLEKIFKFKIKKTKSFIITLFFVKDDLIKD